jgi:tRNA(fMet)-specific endonuclease VapC
VHLLDTNVLSEVTKKRPEPKVTRRLEATRREDLYTSVVCLMELRFGAVRHPRAGAIWKRIQSDVLSRISIISVLEPEALLAGEILADLERRGEPIGTEDVLIAATALRHGLTVATRNTKHLARVKGLKVESWWE